MTESKYTFKLGDAISTLARVLHIPHCPRCEQRRRILNEIQTLGVAETLRRLRAVSAHAPDSAQVHSLMKQLDDCCND